MSASLVGSEMCIRDRARLARKIMASDLRTSCSGSASAGAPIPAARLMTCLLYTSDAADDM
eukprot:5304993-Alexandrium_andersonii.AAC.1